MTNIKLTVMIQYVGHVINAGGSVEYRSVEIELNDEQSSKLKLQKDEYYGASSFTVLSELPQ